MFNNFHAVVSAIQANEQPLTTHEIDHFSAYEHAILERFVKRYNERYRAYLAIEKERRILQIIYDDPMTLQQTGVGVPERIVGFLMEKLIKVQDYVNEACYQVVRNGAPIVVEVMINNNTLKAVVNRYCTSQGVKLFAECLPTGFRISQQTQQQLTSNQDDFKVWCSGIIPGEKKQYTGTMSKQTLIRYTNSPEMRDRFFISEERGVLFVGRTADMRHLVPAIYKVFVGQGVTEADVRAAIAEFMQIRASTGVPAVMGIEDPDNEITL